jgi:MEMO1 family protein
LIRQPAVAGTFYPGDAALLRQTLKQLMNAPAPAPGSQRPKALIAPHAGYVYSGGVAGEAYARLLPYAETIRRVVLLGPAHRVRVRGLALPEADRFMTPLGEVPVDQEAVRRLAGVRQVATSGAAHAPEHSIEVQLPFLQSVLRDFTLVPLAVGDATVEEVAEVLDLLWGGPETLIVVSSDLSHYLPYAVAQQKDHDTVERILRGELLDSFDQACGALPIDGLLQAARRHGLTPRLVSQCNSGDTAGDRQRVVGYAAIEFLEDAADGRKETADTAEERGPVLLGLARSAIAHALGRTSQTVSSAPWLRAPGASFVTLKQEGALRGCVGSLEAYRPLTDDVAANARAAAFRDTRFRPLAAEEFERTRIEVSLLSPMEPLPAPSEGEAFARMRPRVDGIVLDWKGRRATFLPQVWEDLPDPRDFLAHLKRKAGLPLDFWAEDLRLFRYTVAKWSEPEKGSALS